MSFGKELDKLIVEPGAAVSLGGLDPRDKLGFEKASAKAQLAEDAAEIDRLQDLLFAEGKRALLVVLQGTDTSGKDGTVREVFHETGPLGLRVVSFRAPTEEERSHDYLWRIHAVCPPRGTIGIFNRSHYEDVLVVKVHGLAPAEEVEARYDQINSFEKTLVENGTTILKFMLHISKDEQRERLQARLDEADKRWKFQPGDLEDRKQWDAFIDAYDIALSRCSTAHAPWYIVPSDRKWVRSAAIARIVRRTLEAMDPQPKMPGWDPKSIVIE